MPCPSLARAMVLFAALASAPSARSQDPLPLPLPVPPGKAESKAEPSDSRVTPVDRGPVHEGFAQPGANVRGKGITAPVAPPAPVDEVPPEPKPEGAGVKFLPGYWHWDAEREDFVWVCGCYRTAPPERTWEPGRWKEANKVWTYFPGYWRPTDAKTLAANLPEPPASKDEAPAPNTNPNAMWVPGFWEYKSGKFEWQPGYWPPGNGTMIWHQGQYVTTETGFVFVPGHWDYPLEERGVLFTPVEFSPVQREKRGWSYRPEFAISFGSEAKWGEGGVFDALCIGPNYNSYFCGDYAQWRNVGSFAHAGGGLPSPPVRPAARSLNETGEYQPWDAVSRGYTNPLWQHYLRLNRTDSGWRMKGPHCL